MSERQLQQFSSATPRELIRVLETVDVLLSGTRQAISQIPLSDGIYDGTYHDALNCVQEAVKEDWTRVARVKWMEFGLEAWEKWVREIEPDSEIPDLNSAQFPREYVGGMSYGTVSHFLTHRHLGSDCNRLMDHFLHILGALRALPNAPSSVGSEMKSLIRRRTNCSRDDDPHRDETAYKLLMAHHGLE